MPRRTPVVDAYRTTLFKRHIRKQLGAPWLRFYFSIGKCHLCIEVRDFMPEDRPLVLQDLKRAGIDFNVSRWSEMSSFFGDEIRTINIPIDQAALPERKRRHAEKEAAK
jgi:hypothetical protein